MYKSVFCDVQGELFEKLKSDAASGKETVTSTVSSVDEEKDDLLIGQSGILLIFSDSVIVHALPGCNSIDVWYYLCIQMRGSEL